MTEIHFCDLCNESVPDVDLKAGRAILIKGRVVCAVCNRAMGAAGAAAHASASGTLPAPAPDRAPLAVPPLGGSHHAAPRRSSSAAGLAIGIALLAVAGAGVLWQWTSQQLRASERRAAERAGLLEADQRSAVAAAEATRQELREIAASIERQLGERLGAQTLSLEGRFQEQARGTQGLAAKLAELEPRFASVDEALGRVGRHDQELVVLQQRYSELLGELQGLSDKLDSELALAREVVAAPQPVQPTEQKPVWSGLVEQLSRPSTSERWQAVVALGETRDPAAAPHVVGALQDQDIFIRMAAARVLGDLGNPVAVEPLIAALADGEGAVREAAYIALQALTKAHLPFDPQSEDSGERNKRIKAWREWWEKERGKVGV